MEKVMLKVFTLAAAAIAPHLIASDTKAAQVKHIEELSVEEQVAITHLTEKAVHNGNYDTEKRSIES